MLFISKIAAWLIALFAKKAIEHSFNGVIADVKDPRDHIYPESISVDGITARATLPALVDLSTRFGPIEQQGPPNTCVGHAVTSVFEAITHSTDRSRLFVYWNARSYVGQTSTDAGCQIRNAMRGISQYGVPAETAWPYGTALSQIVTKPSAAAYSAALPEKAKVAAYVSVTSLLAMKTALANGQPVAFSFMVPDTFISITKPTGHLPFPTTAVTWLGGHAVVAVGYDDATGNVLVRNSFGSTWGKNGYFTMPYQWFATIGSRVSDMWTLTPKV